MNEAFFCDVTRSGGLKPVRRNAPAELRAPENHCFIDSTKMPMMGGMTYASDVNDVAHCGPHLENYVFR